jgi:hypothetical protein
MWCVYKDAAPNPFDSGLFLTPIISVMARGTGPVPIDWKG